MRTNKCTEICLSWKRFTNRAEIQSKLSNKNLNNCNSNVLVSSWERKRWIALTQIDPSYQRYIEYILGFPGTEKMNRYKLSPMQYRVPILFVIAYSTRNNIMFSSILDTLIKKLCHYFVSVFVCTRTSFWGESTEKLWCYNLFIFFLLPGALLSSELSAAATQEWRVWHKHPRLFWRNQRLFIAVGCVRMNSQQEPLKLSVAIASQPALTGE